MMLRAGLVVPENLHNGLTGLPASPQLAPRQDAELHMHDEQSGELI
jgi:hypothetical protein